MLKYNISALFQSHSLVTLILQDELKYNISALFQSHSLVTLSRYSDSQHSYDMRKKVGPTIEIIVKTKFWFITRN